MQIVRVYTGADGESHFEDLTPEQFAQIVNNLGDGPITYGSPIFKAVQKKRYKALYRGLKKSPKSLECAVGADSKPSHVDRSVGIP